jgi:SNF2 family DNA or RNA helicase
MGLGKTLEALCAAKAFASKHNCPIIVIAPASLKDVWAREAAKVEVPIEIFSWAKVPPPLQQTKYLLIGDESHFMQTLNARRTKAMLALAQHENCLATWLLTGTPIKNGRPVNLYPLLLAANHPTAQNRRDYEERFCNRHLKPVGRGRQVWDVSGAAHLDELSKLTEDVILRRTKKECLDLPAKTRQWKPAELTPAASREYHGRIRGLIDDYHFRAAAGLVDPAAEALVTLNILRKVGSSAKVATSLEMAEELLEQGQQVVLFTEFLDSAHQLERDLRDVSERLGMGAVECLTGATPQDQRQAMVDRFQSGESGVFVSTTRAGGVGITLTAASHVILVDRPWTPGDAEQAEDRAHRIGQHHPVNTYWVQLGDIDDAIDTLLEQKQERIELVLKGKRKTLRGLSSPAALAKELLEALR